MDDVMERPKAQSESTANTKSVQLVIEGRVQGVGFRAWAKSTARKLGLNGFVRNRADGTVEVQFSGPQHRVDQMIEACHDGPLVSRVMKVSVHPSKKIHDTGFRLEATI